MIVWLASAGIARADDVSTAYNDVDIIDMPNARMMPDGALSVGADFFKNTERYNFDFQALPWLETSFHYTGLDRFAQGFPVYYDRAFIVKARLFDETSYTPAIAIGINDLVGTEVYGSEYLVASKRFGDFDATLGLGWGTLGTANNFKNPLIAISQSFASRPDLGTPGGFSLKDFFHGPTTGVFAGVSWHTPISGLSVIAELSSDKYTIETTGIGACCNFIPRSQFNFGVSYLISPSTTLGLNWLYDTSIGGSIAFQLDPTTDAFPQRLDDPELPAFHARTSEEQQQALNQILSQHDPQRVELAKLMVDHRNALVDDLWNEVPAPGDIAITGRTLMIRASDINTQNLCAKVSPLVSLYGDDIDSILLQTGSSSKPTSCAITRRGLLLTATLRIDTGTWTLGAVATATPVLTIDASVPPNRAQQSAVAAIRADAAKQKITILALSLTDSEAIVYYSNTRYFHEPEAVDRLVRVLMADAPPNIEKFRLLSTLGSVPQDEFDILRAPTERNIAQTGNYHLLSDGNTLTTAPMQNAVLTQAEQGAFPRFTWDVFPQFRQELFDPSNPFAVQLLAGVEGAVELIPQLSLTGEAELNIYDNYNTGRASDSVLPHVRTDFVKFFTEGKNGIGQLETNYLFRIAPDVFAVARAGYLESMYAGVGGEILWRPENQRWALDADIFDVEERNFDRLFGLQKYHVLTGHVSLFYESPWYGFIFGIHAGQYLAGDDGFTIDITRRFSTGVELGAFFTKTNVSAAQFGEGSFDKGFIVSIPIGWTLPVNTQKSLDTIIRPVQRDGGQRLDNDESLYEYTRRSSLAEVLRDPDVSPP